MSILADTENTPAAWTRRAQAYTDPAAAVGWSPESQEARFTRILAALNPRPFESLLDYGCGTGALAEAMEPRHCDAKYVGFDWSLGMVARAKREHPHATFVTQLPDGDTWDLVVCSGTFNLADNWSKAQTWALMRMLWARTGRAMAVSLYTGRDPACIRYVPSEVATTAQALAESFSVERWRPNDLLVVLRR